MNESLEFLGLNPKGKINHTGIVRAVERVPSTYEGAGEHDTSIQIVFEDRRTYIPTAAQRRRIQQTLGYGNWGDLVGLLVTIRSGGHGVARSITIGEEPPAWLNLVPPPWEGSVAGPGRYDEVPELEGPSGGGDPDAWFFDLSVGQL